MLSEPLFVAGDTAGQTDLGTFQMWTTGANPPFSVQDNHALRGGSMGLTNSTHGNAARTFHQVTDYIQAAYLVPYINGFSAREAVWSEADQAWVTHQNFPNGWTGRVPTPAGSTIELFHTSSWNGSQYELSDPWTTAVAASDVPALPLAGNHSDSSIGWSLNYTWDNTDRQILTRPLTATLAPGETFTGDLGMRQERPTNSGQYGLMLIESLTARLCLPAPTITGWTSPSIDGLGTITGTGTFPGDTVAVTDENGAEIGTAVVADDLTWSFTLAEPLLSGSHLLTATETDSAWSTPERPLTGTSAPADHPVGTPALVAAITDAGGSTTGDEPRERSDDSPYPVTITVANSGTATVHDVTLGAVTVTHGVLTDLACAPDITGAGATLLPGEQATCTAQLSGLIEGQIAQVSANPTATSPVTETGLDADADYWAELVEPTTSTTGTSSSSSSDNTSTPTTPTETIPSESTSGESTSGATPFSDTGSSTTASSGSTHHAMSVSTATSVLDSTRSGVVPPTRTTVGAPAQATPTTLASTGAGPINQVAWIGGILLALGGAAALVSRRRKAGHV